MSLCFAWAACALRPGGRSERLREPSALAAAEDVILEPVTPEGLRGAMGAQAKLVRPWRHGDFAFVRRLQPASRNNGYVDAMMPVGGRGGRAVAVKRMPAWWVCADPEEFESRHPSEAERPWVELGVLSQLQSRRYPYSCELWGVFLGSGIYSVVSDLATDGDLLEWCARLPKRGRQREELVHPVAAQTCHAVALLHELGVAHRDLSLENIALTQEGDCGLRVKLIDFSMSSVGRAAAFEGQPLGKRSYAAPEQHLLERGETYDAFSADAFALGVAVFCMTLGGEPWPTTEPGAPLFEAITKAGVRAHLLGIWRCSMGMLSETLSLELADFLAGLLSPDPSARWCLGEACYQGTLRSCWGSDWMQPYAGAAAFGAALQPSDKDRLCPISGSTSTAGFCSARSSGCPSPDSASLEMDHPSS